MSAGTATATAASTAELANARLSVGGVLRSEWVKLRTLRSTAWCLAVVAVLIAALPPLISLILPPAQDVGATVPEVAAYNWAQASTIAVGFGVLVVGVLGCLVITGEYSTGMIRSTMTAVPRRIPALLSKALVTGLMVLVVTLVALVIGVVTSGLVLGAKDYAIEWGDGTVWWAALAAAGYLALIAVFSVGVGGIVRNSAGAIAIVLGLLLVVPTILQLAAGLTGATWPLDIGAFLPSSLGSSMYTPAAPSAQAFTPDWIVLEAWQASLVMVGWAVVAVGLAGVLLRRRDV